jgi:hypothetical protein
MSDLVTFIIDHLEKVSYGTKKLSFDDGTSVQIPRFNKIDKCSEIFKLYHQLHPNGYKQSFFFEIFQELSHGDPTRKISVDAKLINFNILIDNTLKGLSRKNEILVNEIQKIQNICKS